MFQIDGEPEAITLCVTEQVREPGSYEKIITRTYRTPVSIGEGREDEALLLHSRPDVKTQEPGRAFDYFNSRLNVRQVRCMDAAGDFEIPEGMKLVVAAVWREAEEWPHVSDIQSMTALIGEDHTVYPNITDWALKDEFEVDTGDLWQFYYKYNYESDKVNPDSILQFYVVPEDMEQAEMAFPVITSSDEAENREEYWQLRVLLTLPDVNETREFD